MSLLHFFDLPLARAVLALSINPSILVTAKSFFGSTNCTFASAVSSIVFVAFCRCGRRHQTGKKNRCNGGCQDCSFHVGLPILG
jgi:hypothetical protein